MAATQHIVTRCLIWMVALAVPTQDVAFASCGCHGSQMSQIRLDASAGDCCASQPRSHCDGCQPRDRKCCETGACPCGAGCQCGDGRESGTPAVPANESRAERVLVCVIANTPTARRVAAGVPSLRSAVSVPSQESTSLECCVVLCRFTV